MKEIIATGKSLEEVRDTYSQEWACAPEELQLEILEKPGLFNRSFKVKVMLPEDAVGEDTVGEEAVGEDTVTGDSAEEALNGSVTELFQTELPDITRVFRDSSKYRIVPGSSVERIVPYPQVGKLFVDGIEIETGSQIRRGDIIEFIPVMDKTEFSWDIIIDKDGRKAVARVWHEDNSRYVLADEIPNAPVIVLEHYVTDNSTVDPDKQDKIKTEEDLMRKIAARGIIHGIKPNLWADIQTVENQGQIIIAEATPPVPTVQPELIDYVGEPIFQNNESNEDKIDYFACKIKVCKENDLLAKKVPGKEGTPGTDIFGKPIPVEKMKDFMLNLKKNVYLTQELEIKASCSGNPVRVNANTYSVENIFVQNKDIDLSTGSIDFPGDVFIGGNVADNLYIHSAGTAKIMGSVSGAEIKADTGLIVKNNIIASKIVVGEKHVFRSEFIKSLQEMNEELASCISQLEQLQVASGNMNIGQMLKLILEKNFQAIPKKAEDLEKLLSYQEPDYVSKDLDLAIKTLKHFLVGLGPLQLKDIMYLKNASRILGYFMSTKGTSTPTSVLCDVNYIQNSEVSCAGDFICHKGLYNSILKIEGFVKIQGVCRGGEINCSGDLYIGELGASNMSATTIRTGKNSRINIELCHSNIKIYVGKELVTIDEPTQKLEIYRDKGILQIGKLRWDGNTGNPGNPRA